MQIIEQLGLIAGLSGIGVGLMLYLFRNIISEKILKMVKQEHRFKIIMTFMFLVWSISGFALYSHFSKSDCASGTNIGKSCDDNNSRTKNDRINSNCECIGTYDCNVKQKNFGDRCDDGNSKTKNEKIQRDCSCKGELKYDCENQRKNIGDSCNDNDPHTQQDRIQSNCICKGAIVHDCERESYSYIVKTKTANHNDAGTNDKIEIRLYSNTDFTRWIHLDNPRVNDFIVNRENVFQFDSNKKISPLTKIELKITKLPSNNTSHVDDLFIEKIKVEESLCNLKTEYKTINKWLGDGQGQRPQTMVQRININWNR